MKCLKQLQLNKFFSDVVVINFTLYIYIYTHTHILIQMYIYMIVQ